MVGGAGGTEPVEADHRARVTDPALPPEGRRRLDRDPGTDRGWQHLVAVRRLLGREPLPGRHGDHAGRDAVRRQLLGRADAVLDLRAGPDEHDLGIPVAEVAHDVGAALDRVIRLRAQRWQALPREREQGRPVAFDRDPPGPDDLVAVGRAQHGQAGHRPQRGEVLDRLVGRSVLTEPDRVVGHDVHDLLTHERGQPDRRPGVVGEDEEGRHVGQHAPVECHPVGDRRHGVLTHPEPQVASQAVVGGEVAPVLHVGVVGRGEVGRPPDQLGQHRRERVDHRARVLAGRVLALERRQRVGPAGRQLAAHDAALELRGELAVGVGVVREAALPGLMLLATARADVEVLPHVVGDRERLVVGPAELGLGQGHLVLAERGAVHGRRPGLVGRAVADHGAHRDERGPGIGVGRRHGGAQRVEVVAVIDPLRVPSVGVEPGGHILGEGEVGRAVDRDRVRVVEVGDPAEAQVPGERRGLGGDALHQVAVGHDAEDPLRHDVMAGAVELGREPLRGQRHADTIAEALPERAGRGLDALEQEVLGVTGGRRPELAELLDLVERRVLVAGEVQRRVQQHRPVPRRQDEAVAAGPGGIRRIVAHDLAEQQVGHRRAPHRHAGVPGVGALDGVHREGAVGVDGPLDEVVGHAGSRGSGGRAAPGTRVRRRDASGRITRSILAAPPEEVPTCRR